MIDCTFENGGKGNLRHACANIIILNELRDSILLTKRAPQLLEGGKWCLPGGYMELNQTIEESAVREALEETGYVVELQRLVCIADAPQRHDNGRQNIVFVFLGIAKEKTSSADNESTAQEWFPLTKLPPKNNWAFDHHAMLATYTKTQAPTEVGGTMFLH